MKKILLLATLIIFISAGVYAQTETNGFVVLNDGNKVEGNLTEQFKKTRSIQLTNASGKQTEFYAETIKAAVIGSTNYSSFQNEFFETVLAGNKYILLKKETKVVNSISYNGTEPIIIPSTEGNINDLFILVKENNELIMLTKKNYRKKLQSLFSGCPAIDKQSENTVFGKETVVLLMNAYNDCK